MKKNLQVRFFLLGLLFCVVFLGLIRDASAKTQDDCYGAYANCFDDESSCQATFQACMKEATASSSGGYAYPSLSTGDGTCQDSFGTSGSCKFSCGSGETKSGTCDSRSGANYAGYDCCLPSSVSLDSQTGAGLCETEHPGASCIDTKKYSGTYSECFKGLCPGAANIQCCLPRSLDSVFSEMSGNDNGDDNRCSDTYQGASCVDINSYSEGEPHECFKGLCPGAANIQCCRETSDTCAGSGGRCVSFCSDNEVPIIGLPDCDNRCCIPDSGNSGLSNPYSPRSPLSANCGVGFENIGGLCFPANTNLSNASISDILFNLFSWLMGLFTLFAVMAFVISGIQYLLSSGNEELAEDAKKNASNAVIGIIVGLSGFIIVQAIAMALSGSSRIF